MMTEPPRIARMLGAVAFPGRRSDRLIPQAGARVISSAKLMARGLQTCRSFFQRRRFPPHIAVGRCVVGNLGL
jgi:hypothetical protein